MVSLNEQDGSQHNKRHQEEKSQFVSILQFESLSKSLKAFGLCYSNLENFESEDDEQIEALIESSEAEGIGQYLYEADADRVYLEQVLKRYFQSRGWDPGDFVPVLEEAMKSLSKFCNQSQ
jgi:hypothetical protein